MADTAEDQAKKMKESGVADNSKLKNPAGQTWDPVKGVWGSDAATTTPPAAPTPPVAPVPAAPPAPATSALPGDLPILTPEEVARAYQPFQGTPEEQQLKAGETGATQALGAARAGQYTSPEQQTIAQAKEAASQTFEPQLQDALNKRLQGMSRSLISAGQRGGFLNSQQVGVAATDKTVGGEFVGVGGQLSQIASEYDQAVYQLQSEQKIAVKDAELKAQQAVESGDEQKLKEAQAAYDRAQSNFDHVGELIQKKGEFLQKAEDHLLTRAQVQQSLAISQQTMALNKQKLQTDAINNAVPSLYSSLSGTIADNKTNIANKAAQMGVDPAALQSAMIEYETQKKKDVASSDKEALAADKLRLDNYATLATSQASGLVNIDVNTGKVYPPSEQQIKDTAERTKIPIEILSKAVDDRIAEAKKMNLEERRVAVTEYRAQFAGMTSLQKDFQFANSQGYTGSFEEFMAAKSGKVTSINPADAAFAASIYLSQGKVPPVGRFSAGVFAQVVGEMSKQAKEQGLDANLIQLRTMNSSALKAGMTDLIKTGAFIDSFEGTSKKNLQVFLDSTKTVIDTGSPFANRVFRGADRELFGSNDQVAFDVARITAFSEISKVLTTTKGTGIVSDSARSEIEKILSGDYTVGQLQTAANILIQDMDNRKSSNDAAINGTKQALADLYGENKSSPTVKQQLAPSSEKPTTSTPSGATKDWKQADSIDSMSQGFFGG